MRDYPKIPLVFAGKVPSDFINDLDGWSLSKEKVLSSKGKLINLDLDYGVACSLKCPMCFRKGGILDKEEYVLKPAELKDIIKELKPLGLESVRVLGGGEPFENEGFLEFLEWLKKENLKSVVFTQGHKITPILAKKLQKLNTSLMIRYDSFDDKVIDYSTGIKGMKKKKDQALEMLADVGFNKNNPTKVGVVAPITRYALNDIFEIYRFFRERNIYPLIPPLACAGRSILPDGSVKDDVSEEEKIILVTKIYEYNFEKGIQFDGVSSYIGGHICTFLSNGFYLTSTGLVLRCEGDDNTVVGDIRKEPITKLWKRSENNLKFGGKYNYGCPPKAGRSIPLDFYKKIEENLKEKGLFKA